MRTKVHLVQFLIFFFFTADFEKGRENLNTIKAEESQGPVPQR